MKKIAIILLFLAPLTSYAQNPMGMSQQDMQQMMQQMQKAQVCMAKIDQAELDALGERANKFDAEMKSLCASGKKDAAQKQAMVYMKEVINSTAVKQAKKCGEMMEGAMKAMGQGMNQGMPFMDEDIDYSSQHVCDSY